MESKYVPLNIEYTYKEDITNMNVIQLYKAARASSGQRKHSIRNTGTFQQ